MMALVIMGFWLGILCGRLAWAGLSSRLSSGWPVLAASLTIVVAFLGVVGFFLAAAPVPRVHCDYTHDGAPRRLLQLGEAQRRATGVLFRAILAGDEKKSDFAL